MAGKRLPIRLSLRSQLWFRGTGMCFETATSHMQTVEHKLKKIKMAIYYPPLFCGIGTTLKVIKAFEIEFENGESMTVSIGDECIVKDIIGYGYNIKKNDRTGVFRIMNSKMPNYFNIIDKVELEKDLDNYERNDKKGSTVTLQKNLEIKDMVVIPKGQQFLHFIDDNKDGKFHDLFTLDGKHQTLRMKHSEFKEYFKK